MFAAFHSQRGRRGRGRGGQGGGPPRGCPVTVTDMDDDGGLDQDAGFEDVMNEVFEEETQVEIVPQSFVEEGETTSAAAGRSGGDFPGARLLRASL